MSAGAVTAILDYNRPAPDEGVTAAPKTGNKIFVFILMGLAALIAVGILVSFLSKSSTTRFQDAVAACATAGNAFRSDHVVDDQGKTIHINVPEGTLGDDWEGVKCVLSHLNFPPSMWEKMSQTSAMDGTQSETNDGVRVTWSYSKLAGADLVFSDISDSGSTGARAVDYNDLATLENGVAESFNAAAGASAYPGVTQAQRVTCVASGERVFDCIIAQADGNHTPQSFVVSEDGATFVAKSS